MDVNVLAAEQRTGIRSKPVYKPDLSVGTRQKYSKAIAKRFCDLTSRTHLSVMDLIRANPDLPPYDQIESWRCHNKNGFADQLRKARESQAHHLVQLSFTLAAATNPKNAHSQRVKFDIYKWIAAKLNPTAYGDKPPTTTTNVAIGFNISTERLNEIRSKLDVTRDAFIGNPKRTSNGSDSIKPSSVRSPSVRSPQPLVQDSLAHDA